jgi:hydroxymethylglutaryl-CoA synthase
MPRQGLGRKGSLVSVGVVAYGSYVPWWRLERATIAQALGARSGRGTRAVASYDEDATSMGVEAARGALATSPAAVVPQAVYFATTAPPYLDKTNATTIHAALDLPESVMAVDMVGSVRSAAGAWRAALDAAAAGRPTLAVLGDVRTGLPGSGDERDGGDGAAALLFGRGDHVLAEVRGAGSASAEFLDRWRAPGEPGSKVWEERFGEHAYVPLAEAAVADACKGAGVPPDAVHHAIVTGTQTRAVRRVAGSVGLRPEALTPDLTAHVGHTGVAHAALALADLLDRAEPDRWVLVVQLADGADAFVLRTTEAVGEARARCDGAGSHRRTVAEQVAAGRTGLGYETFLTWRGLLRREPPRRPEPDRPAAPPSYRREGWKFSLVGSRCQACGTCNVPPQRVCVGCHAVDDMVRQPLADIPATVATFTVDHLAYSLSPPVVAAVIDFEGGGRYQCELTDVDPTTVAIGDRVDMTFRRLHTADGVHNYFWKAKPRRGQEGSP